MSTISPMKGPSIPSEDERTTRVPGAWLKRVIAPWTGASRDESPMDFRSRASPRVGRPGQGFQAQQDCVARKDSRRPENNLMLPAPL